MVINTDHPIHFTYFGRANLKGKWHNGKILWNANLLMYLESGSMRMTVGDRPLTASAGDVVVIPKGTRYVPINADDMHFYFFHFTSSDLEAEDKESKITLNSPPTAIRFQYNVLTRNPLIHVNLITHCQQDSRVKSIVKRLGPMNPWHNSNDMLLLDALLRELLVTICTEGATYQALNPNLHKLLKYIAFHYQEEITLSDLSDQSGLSKSYIAKLFRKELHTTSSNYINQIRISIAGELLHKTELSIVDIAEQVGFHDQNYFSRVFQKYYNVTPSEFRKNGVII